MVKKLTIRLLITLVIISFSVASERKVVADKSEIENPVGFSYYNDLPENQITPGDYFDILVEPNSEQELKTIVTNETSSEQTLVVTISDATTTEDGLINYYQSFQEEEQKSQLKLTEIVSGPAKVILKAGETKAVSFNVKTPATKFEGILLGGVELALEGSLEQTGSVSNTYAYVFSISVRESAAEVPIDLSSGEIAYFTKEADSHVSFDLRNESPEIVRALALETTIKKVENGQIITAKTVTGLKMAPQSVLNYVTPVSELADGWYEMKLNAIINDQDWHFTKQFEIRKGEINQQLRDPEKRTMGQKEEWITCLSTLIILLGAVFFYVKIKAINKTRS